MVTEVAIMFLYCEINNDDNNSFFTAGRTFV